MVIAVAGLGYTHFQLNGERGARIGDWFNIPSTTVSAWFEGGDWDREPFCRQEWSILEIDYTTGNRRSVWKAGSETTRRSGVAMDDCELVAESIGYGSDGSTFLVAGSAGFELRATDDGRLLTRHPPAKTEYRHVVCRGGFVAARLNDGVYGVARVWDSRTGIWEPFTLYHRIAWRRGTPYFLPEDALTMVHRGTCFARFGPGAGWEPVFYHEPVINRDGSRIASLWETAGRRDSILVFDTSEFAELLAEK
jgi:hypothetical protein